MKDMSQLPTDLRRIYKYESDWFGFSGDGFFVEVPLKMLPKGHPGLASSKATPVRRWTYTMERGGNPQRSSFRHLMRQFRCP
jgi:hypothetical protein